jgi:hypothetical protein
MQPTHIPAPVVEQYPPEPTPQELQATMAARAAALLAEHNLVQGNSYMIGGQTFVLTNVLPSAKEVLFSGPTGAKLLPVERLSEATPV